MHGDMLEFNNRETTREMAFILEDLEGVMLEKRWRKCMGIEPTRDGFSAPHRI